MHKLTIQLSDKSGYNYDLVNDKNGKIIHSWKRPKMLEKWIDGYIPGNGRNFIQYVEKNGSAKIKVKPNKFIIPFREGLDYTPLALDGILKKSQEIGRDFRKMAHSISRDLDAKDNRVVAKCLKAYNNYFALLKQMNKVLK